jgi:hypothetical protein
MWGVSLFFVACVLLPLIARVGFSMRANQVSDEIKRLEQIKREQQASLVRVSAVWNQMTEPQRLSEAMARKGLVMNVAKPHRQVRVREGSRAFVMNEKLRRELAALRSVTTPSVSTAATASTARRKRSR